MKIEPVLGIAFIAFLAAIAQLLSSTAGLAVSVFVGILSGLTAWLRDYIPETFPRAGWPIPATLLLASIAGVGAQLSRGEWLWLIGPVCACGTALLVDAFRDRSRRRCSLCNRRLGRELAFECPRCHLVVCDRSCWSFEYLRCRLCLDNEVPLFTPDGRWWDRQLGPAFQQGNCQVCLTPGADADLRACRQCGRPQCRGCWDMMNGQCSRCHWVVEDLPPMLAEYMGTAKSGARSGSRPT